MPTKILLVEDDVFASEALTKVLQACGYLLDVAREGKVGLDLATAFDYDLILLNLQMPTLDGVNLCQKLRSQSYLKPILLLTANDSDAEVAAGFEAGADDYISKPYDPEILLARIRMWLRRSGVGVPTANLTWGKLSLNLDSGKVRINQQIVAITSTEFNLLELFLRNPDRIFSRSVILDRLWGFDDAPSDRAVVTHIKDLRKKLKVGGLTEDMIETVYGMGYRLKPAPQSQTGGTEKKTTSKAQLLANVLERFRGVFNEQIAVLERAKTALLAGNLEVELQQAARQEAHKLAGSLASFGYPEGSKLARSIEHGLREDVGFSPENIIRFSEWITALQQELAKPPIESIALPTATRSTQTYRVLVIDDDAALTERLKIESDAWGFRLKIASNLAIARSRLNLSNPDLILLDLSFPEAEEDGLLLLQEIAKRSPNLPVIVFTGRDSLDDRLAVSRLGARQFLHKPVSPEQIFRAIARILAQPQTTTAKVLVVDDDPAMLALLSSLLSPWGIEVATLSHPQHFWNVLVATSPHLVVLDLEMPQISGLELCQVVRQDAQWENLPILVVTAHTDAESLQQAFAAGADDFIAKPVLGPELVARVLSRMQRTR